MSKAFDEIIKAGQERAKRKAERDAKKVRLVVNGEELTEKEFKKKRISKPGAPRLSRGDHWRTHSKRAYSSSVPAEQAKEFNDLYREHGVQGVQHDRDGNLHASSAKAFRKAMQVRGLVSKNDFF